MQRSETAYRRSWNNSQVRPAPSSRNWLAGTLLWRGGRQEVRTKADLITNLQQELIGRDATLRDRDEEIQRTKAAAIQQKAQFEENATKLQAQLVETSERRNSERSAASQRIELLEHELADARQTLALIESSTAWKLASRVRSAFQNYPTVRLYARQLLAASSGGR